MPVLLESLVILTRRFIAAIIRAIHKVKHFDVWKLHSTQKAAQLSWAECDHLPDFL
jgi:hypothetical protein